MHETTVSTCWKWFETKSNWYFFLLYTNTSCVVEVYPESGIYVDGICIMGIFISFSPGLWVNTVVKINGAHKIHKSAMPYTDLRKHINNPLSEFVHSLKQLLVPNVTEVCINLFVPRLANDAFLTHPLNNPFSSPIESVSLFLFPSKIFIPYHLFFGLYSAVSAPSSQIVESRNENRPGITRRGF